MLSIQSMRKLFFLGLLYAYFLHFDLSYFVFKIIYPDDADDSRIHNFKYSDHSQNLETVNILHRLLPQQS